MSEGKPVEAAGEDALLKLVEKLEKIDVEKLERLVDALTEAGDALADLAVIAKKLKESGILAALDLLAESVDEEFADILKPDLMKAVANVLTLLFFLSKLNNVPVFEVLDKTPSCIDEAYEEFKKPHKRMGLFEMLGLLRGPEFAATLQAMQKMLACLHKNVSRQAEGK